MKNSIEGIMNEVLNLGKESLNESTSVDEAKSKKDGLPDTKKGFTYQDDDGNIYHSDVEIASYIDPETGKETRVFSYGKGAGLGAKTKKPLAVVSGMSNESAKLRRLMRENRRLRRGLRESANVVKIGSDDNNSFYIYDVTPLVDRPVESGEEVAGYIELYDGEDLKVLIKNSIEAYDLDLDDPVDKSINDDLEDVIKKAKNNDIYAVVTDQFREPDVDKIEKALKGAI